MRKFGVILFVLLTSAVVQGQEKKTLFSCMAQNNILNHLDVGVNVGTVGFGIDLSVPVTDYVRIRTGYSYIPPITFHSNFPIETRSGKVSDVISKLSSVDKMISDYGIDLNSEGFEDLKLMYDKFRSIEAKDYVAMGLKPNLHQFKFLVDVMPFKHNKHWSFTAGFFVGPSHVASADNLKSETVILEAVNAYNDIYADYPENGINGLYMHKSGQGSSDPFYRYGLAGFPLGYFADGEKAMMVPSKDNTVRAEMEINKFRPYVGLGYKTHLSRNKKWNLNVDAGVLFITGKPRIYVDNVYKFDASELKLTGEYDEIYLGGIGVDSYDKYYGEIVRNYYNVETGEEKYVYCGNLVNHVDLMRDLYNMPAGKVRDMVNTISKIKVYPNLTVTVSYRLY